MTRRSGPTYDQWIDATAAILVFLIKVFLTISLARVMGVDI